MKASKLTLLLLLIFISCNKSEDLNPINSTNDYTKASAISSAFGTANNQYGKPGPYEVATNAVRGDCRQLFGIASKVLAAIKLLDPEIRCSPAFPYGFEQNFSTEVFYPADIQNLEKLPVINFVGGILSNQGHYDALIKLWTSYGFVVINSNNFINTAPTMHIYGAIEAAKLNDNPKSPLYKKIDLSKMLIAGHSAGGGASILLSSLSQKTLNIIDPRIRIIGSFPIQPGPLALGITVKYPTFITTGELDLIVSPLGWPILWQSNLINHVPSWIATARYATHFSPTLDLKRNEFAGISVAWMLYRGQNDSTASRYFLGSDYLLSSDPQFIQGILNPLAVQRNKKADKL
ncbi:poly(ethylene terephthalate) hydrolase family protein [Sphingobacterium corticibacter]|uniref:Adenylate cyclase n=1 Tax=Sphingobacterium corticibacter TaxID=2171749 RepID=A0A2T8HM86_9SPHI|nr:adenylate cyclase [Sphingobacterium corticibacter]PVH26546.1 adenylate cyclase [Sphingobacterium corticibacter]